jgi:hypothetical protein
MINQARDCKSRGGFTPGGHTVPDGPQEYGELSGVH